MTDLLPHCLKADRDLSKLNFLFHLKSKTNLVILRKCNSHLQYYKIGLIFSIKSQEINLNVCKEFLGLQSACMISDFSSLN